MNIKPFNLAEVKPDLSNLRTRGGRKVLEIHCFERASTASPIVYVDENSKMCSVTLKGEFGFSSHTSSGHDLVLVEEPKLIDWSKLPVDTLIELPGGARKYMRHTFTDMVCPFSCGDSVTNLNTSTSQEALLIENPKFTFWQGGESPVPEGVLIEIVFRNSEVVLSNDHSLPRKLRWKHVGDAVDIIAYRILGAAEGYSPYFQGREF